MSYKKNITSELSFVVVHSRSQSFTVVHSRSQSFTFSTTTCDKSRSWSFVVSTNLEFKVLVYITVNKGSS